VGEEQKRVETDFHYLTADRAAEAEPEPLAPPEKGWAVIGVFTFPWWPGAWARWLILSLLLVPALGLAGVVAMLAGAIGNLNKSMTAVPYLMLPLMWLWVWALSYAAACFVAIVQDTGSGNDEVASWPEGDWRERVGTMLYVGLHLALASAAASALAWPVGTVFGPLGMGLAVALAANFFFPLFLLSSMEADTLLTPYSAVMFRSVITLFFSWLMIYVESLLLLALFVALLGAGLVGAPVPTILFSSPILATLIFIEARLYGRLAWHIGQAATKRKPRKRGKKASGSAAPRDGRAPL
jgi:hypothetical protein